MTETTPAAFALLLATVLPAAAQEGGPALNLTAPCAGAESAMAIVDQYGEQPTATATVTEDGKPFGQMVVTRNPETGSLTIFILGPSGQVCMAIVGEGWEALPRGGDL